MKPRALSSAAALLVILSATLSTYPARALTIIPAHDWSAGFGDAFSQRAYALAMDGSGSVYMAGPFVGSVDFGGGNLVSAGDADIFLVKFNSAGAHVWSRRFGDANAQTAVALAIDASGNVYLTGFFWDTVNFGGSDLVSAGNNDIYIAKFNSAGVHQWSLRFGDVTSQVATSIAVDDAGYVVVTGYFWGTINPGGGNLVSAGNEDIFLARFNNQGGHVWSKRFGDYDHQTGMAVATDPSRNVVLTGTNVGTVDFGGGPLNSPDNYDVYLAKFDSAGNHLWSQRFGDPQSQYATALAIDGASFIYLTGYFNGTVNFGGDNLASAGSADIFLAKFNPGGLHQWSQRFGDSNAQSAYAVATAMGTVCLTGSSAGSVDFGGGSLVAGAGSDAYLACFRWSGEHLWSQHYGDGTNVHEGRALAMNDAQDVALCGQFGGSMNLGGGDIAFGGAFDAFVARFKGLPLEPVITSVADVGNDQGRKVRVRFAKSGMDNGGSPRPVRRYELYRRNDPLAAAAPVEVGESRAVRESAGWVWAGSFPAHGDAVYMADAPTDADSTINGPRYSVFFVRAISDDPFEYWNSSPDSGCSVDNLAPGVPGGLAYANGVLTWTAPDDADLDHYTVYGASTECDRCPVVIGHTALPSMDVAGHPFETYLVTATDRSGNEGEAARVGDTETPLRRGVLSVSSHPNPFNPTTTIRYTLPERGHVRLTIHDARGAEVVMLADGVADAGEHRITWNGRDTAGRLVSSGVYFARLQHDNETRSHKLLLLK